MSEATLDLNAVQLKRLLMRSIRRGTKEMDIILSDFASKNLHKLKAFELEDYERLLEENDQSLYQWISGQSPPRLEFEGLMNKIKMDISKKRQNL